MLHISYEDFAIALFVAFALGLCVVSFIVMHEQEKKIEPTDEQIDEVCTLMHPGFNQWAAISIQDRLRQNAIKWLNAWEAALKGGRR